MSVEDRISQLIWKSEAETVPTKPNPKPRVEPETPEEPETPKPEPTRPRPETVYFDP
jgi:hypothetical protein